MQRIWLVFFQIGISISLSNSIYAQQQVVEWNYNNKAHAVGSGCSNEDTFFISSGNEVSVVFSNLGIDLSGFSGGQKHLKKNCNIKIPGKIRQGYYIGELSESLTYGYARSAKAKGEVIVETDFLGKSAKIFKKVPSLGESDHIEPITSAKGLTRYERRSDFCRSRELKTNLRSKISLSASRDSLDEDISIQLDGYDIRFEALAMVYLCP